MCIMKRGAFLLVGGGWWVFLWFCFGGAYFCEVKVLKTLVWYPFSGSI